MDDLARKLERKLGIPPGKTLTALAKRAFARYPREPWLTFNPLSLDLHWLCAAVPPTGEYRPGPRPRGVVAFTSTTQPRPEFGTVDPYFAFLLDGAKSTDDRPIVVIHPADGKRCARVIAPNLRGFLGLVAYAGAGWMRREWTRAQWDKASLDLEDLFEGGDGVRALRTARKSLLSIPGVKTPKDPLEITRASPDIELTYDPPESPPKALFARVDTLDDPRAAFGAGHADVAERAARAFAKDRCVARTRTTSCSTS